MSPRHIRRMLRLTEDENSRLIANAAAAGLDPAVYARRRATGEPTPTRPRGLSANAIFHADRAARTCSEMAKAASNVGDLAGAHKLDAAAAEISKLAQHLAHDSKGQ